MNWKDYSVVKPQKCCIYHVELEYPDEHHCYTDSVFGISKFYCEEPNYKDGEDSVPYKVTRWTEIE